MGGNIVYLKIIKYNIELTQFLKETVKMIIE